ncbi:right-handed parallel beta-helix repeat-containing protein [Actinoplanes sp. NPDC024001]|uniref:right-handed parallel beta-helix repeat-containing protein n=1 Tax=Actinoplanes sp. NPDC024001 TaxID=3154598 RepID=UPI0033E66B2D
MTTRYLAGTVAAVAASLSLATPALAENAGATVDTEAADRQAALVAAEDSRIDQVRAVAAVAAMRGQSWANPYRLATGDGYTLVLTQRREPYTVTDLLKLAPQTFVRQEDGSYLLTENIYLNSGAKLSLSNPGGLVLRMASTSDGFVSIVSFGGVISLQGSPQGVTKIVSWDVRTKQEDATVEDGRAYIRAIGGQFDMAYTEVSSLGFWSGRTGGISLTGTDRPSTGDVNGPNHLSKTEREQAKAARKATPAVPGAGDVFAQPSGDLAVPDTRFDVPGMSYVSAEIKNSKITNNAFGMFISSANGVSITDTEVRNSALDGLVLHRFATGIDVSRLTTTGNGGDGFVLSRGAQQVRVSDSTAENNGGNGFAVNGLPLATEASASGEFVGSYGNNSVANSVARNNGRYGIEVIGGLNVSVQNNRIFGSDMGIVAREGATNVSISGNQLSGQGRQGIAIRAGVTDAEVTGNVVTGADNAIYVNSAIATVRGNTVQDAKNHGVSMVGDVDGSTLAYNVVGGVGPSALDVSRAEGDITVDHNQTTAWHDTSSFWIKFRHYASPMTMLWTGILLLIILAGVLGMRRRRAGEISQPYANTMSLRTTRAGHAEPEAVRELAGAGVGR